MAEQIIDTLTGFTNNQKRQATTFFMNLQNTDLLNCPIMNCPTGINIAKNTFASHLITEHHFLGDNEEDPQNRGKQFGRLTCPYCSTQNRRKLLKVTSLNRGSHFCSSFKQQQNQRILNLTQQNDQLQLQLTQSQQAAQQTQLQLIQSQNLSQQYLQRIQELENELDQLSLGDNQNEYDEEDNDDDETQQITNIQQQKK